MGELDVAGIEAEVDRQLSCLLDLGQPTGPVWAPDELRAAAARLTPSLVGAAVELPAATPSHVPFVLVLPGSVLPASAAFGALQWRGRPGTLAKGMDDLDRFAPIDGADVPDSLYAVVDVRRGDEHRGRTPESAMADIEAQGRSPITIEEGLALVATHPDALEANHCFQTPGSRAGDRRVPGLWISGRAARLGFCWSGNHHTWLGVASCGRRVAP